MKKVIKIGRFSFILPYFIVPIICVLFENEDLKTAIIISVFFPLFIEPPISLVYPICFLISIICVVLSLKKKSEKKAGSIGIIIAIVLIIALSVAAAFYFINNFKFNW